MAWWFTLLLYVGSYVIGELLKPKGKDTKNGPGEVDPPSADEGIPIPVVFGTARVGVNTVWCGNVRPAPIKVKQKTGLFSSTTTIVGYEYYVGLELGICHGPVDAIIDIVFNNTELLSQEADTKRSTLQGVYKLVTTMVPAYSANIGGGGTVVTLPVTRPVGQHFVRFNIDAPEIFDGEHGNGGVRGAMDVYFGTDTQIVNDYLAAQRLGADNSPNRGICYAVARHVLLSRSPSVPAIDFIVRRCPSVIGQVGTSNINGNANHADIVYETMTNTRWGLGMDPARFDLDSFRSCATRLHTEGDGYSGVLKGGQAAEDFLQDVLRHADGAVTRHPMTGKLTMVLARPGYVVSSLPIFNEANMDGFVWMSGSSVETLNEVKLVFTDREWGFKQRTVQAQNLANQQATGRVRSEQVQFLGISNTASAQRTAERSLRALSSALSRCSFRTHRAGALLMVGSVIRVSWSRYGVSNVVMRVTKVNSGRLEDGWVYVEAVQDIYSMNTAVYTPPPDMGQGVPPSVIVGAPTNLYASNITSMTALLQWMPSPDAIYTEVFVVAGSTPSTAPGNLKATMTANTSQYQASPADGLVANTTYTLTVRHQDVYGVFGTPASITFTTTNVAPTIPRPAAMDLMSPSDIGPGGVSGEIGVVVGLYASNVAFDIEVMRAPDLAGAPNVAAATIRALRQGIETTYTDIGVDITLTSVWWYATRHVVAGGKGPVTKWIKTTGMLLPDVVERPLPVEAQVDEDRQEIDDHGFLALFLNDPQGRILKIEMQSQQGTGAWSTWEDVTSAPSTSVLLVEKHISAIAYRVTGYDGNNYLRTFLFASSVQFSIGTRPLPPVVQFQASSVSGVFNIRTMGDSDTYRLYATVRTDREPTQAEILGDLVGPAGSRVAVFAGPALATGQGFWIGCIAVNINGEQSESTVVTGNFLGIGVTPDAEVLVGSPSIQVSQVTWPITIDEDCQELWIYMQCLETNPPGTPDIENVMSGPFRRMDRVKDGIIPGDQFNLSLPLMGSSMTQLVTFVPYSPLGEPGVKVVVKAVGLGGGAPTPPNPPTLTFTSKTATSITFGVTVPTPAPVLIRLYVNNVQSSDITVTVGAGGTQSVVLSSLTPDTTYNIQASVISAADAESARSAIMSQTTSGTGGGGGTLTTPTITGTWSRPNQAAAVTVTNYATYPAGTSFHLLSSATSGGTYTEEYSSTSGTLYGLLEQGLAAKTRWYRVQARKTGFANSAMSNTISVTMPGGYPD